MGALDKFLRIDDIALGSEKTRVRAIGVICLAFLITQILNLIFMTISYKALTFDHALALMAIAISFATFVYVRYERRSHIYAVIFSACVFGGIAGASYSVGIDSALLPFFVVAVVTNSYLGHWKFNVLFASLSVGFVWILYSHSLALSPLTGSQLEAYEVRIFQRAAQVSMAIMLTCVVSGIYSVLISKQFAKLHKLSEQLKESEQSRVDCLASISHELRTPLNGIHGLSWVLNNSDLPAKEAGYIATIHENSVQMADLIQSMVTFAMSESGGHTPHKEFVCLRENLSPIFNEHKQTAHSKNLKFSAVVDSNLPERVNLDMYAMKFIMNAVVGNAVKFTDEGQIDIRLEYVQEKNQGNVIVHVCDTGIGIASDNLDKIGKRFFRVDRSKNRVRSGLGLGLATVNNLLDVIGGEMSICSSEGQGTRVRLRVPVDVTDENEQLKGTLFSSKKVMPNIMPSVA